MILDSKYRSLLEKPNNETKQILDILLHAKQYEYLTDIKSVVTPIYDQSGVYIKEVERFINEVTLFFKRFKITSNAVEKVILFEDTKLLFHAFKRNQRVTIYIITDTDNLHINTKAEIYREVEKWRESFKIKIYPEFIDKFDSKIRLLETGCNVIFT